MEKRFLKEGDSTSVKKIDVGVENKWSWKWQDEIVTRQLIEGTVSYKMRDCIFKYDVAGEAWCKWCEDKLKYGSSGKKALHKHCGTVKHIKHLRTIAGNYMITTMKSPSTSLKSIGESRQDDSQKLFSLFKDSTLKKGSSAHS